MNRSKAARWQVINQMSNQSWQSTGKLIFQWVGLAEEKWTSILRFPETKPHHTIKKKYRKQLRSLKENSLKRFTIQTHSSVSFSWPPKEKEHPNNDKQNTSKVANYFLLFKKKNKKEIAKPLGMCKYINSTTKQKKDLIWKCGLSSNSQNVSFYFLLQFSPLMIKGWTSPPGSSAESPCTISGTHSARTHTHPARTATRNTAK